MSSLQDSYFKETSLPPVSIPIADLHADLLSFLEEDEEHTAEDLAVRCSISQLKTGGVRLQVLPIFTETQPKSAQKGLAQAEIYRLLPIQHPLSFTQLSPKMGLEPLENGKIALLAAIENASSFCEENETFAQGMERLRLFFGKIGRPLYISLTWNSENRFGGGADTEVGLKDDGRRLLDFLHAKQIALDFSHASDLLAEEMLAHIDQKQLDIPMIISHSNARAICDVKRNCPDFLLEELKKRDGLIGVNVVRPFVGPQFSSHFPEHVRYLSEKVGLHAISLGADFFCDLDLPAHRVVKSPVQGFFFPDCADSSYYPHLLELLRETLQLSPEQMHQIAYGNFTGYLQKIWGLVEKPEQTCTGVD